MTQAIYVGSVAPASGKVLVTLGLMELALRETARVGFFRPVISGDPGSGKDEDIELVLSQFDLEQSYEASYAWHQGELLSVMGGRGIDPILEKIIRRYRDLAASCDLMIIEGTDYQSHASSIEFDLNAQIARNLSAETVLVGSATGLSPDAAAEGLRVALDVYRGRSARVLGAVLNRAPLDVLDAYRRAMVRAFNDGTGLLGVFPEDLEISYPTVRELARHLGARVLFGSERLDMPIGGYLDAAMHLQNLLGRLRPQQVILTPGDRSDLLLGLIEADRSVNAPRLSGVLLTSGLLPGTEVMKLLEGLRVTLPVLLVEEDALVVAESLRSIRTRIGPPKSEKVKRSLALFEKHAEVESLGAFMRATHPEILTPRMFTYNLLVKARRNRRHIVMPEGSEPRVVGAVKELLSRNAVTITLLGNEAEVLEALHAQGVELDGLTLRIVNPATSSRLEAYSMAYHELRKHKGVTLDQARDFMQDVSYFGTMMVYLGEADGMVSGAIHTTQHTIRPALQIIRTDPGCAIVSSVFFMCLEEGVVVYGDCAVNPDPTASELSDIAIRSAETAKLFGVEPQVALLSYSTGDSGSGADVEKVREAVCMTRRKRPDLPIEGPIQYDAAVDEGVARLKLPGSKVAGRATVLIFPDLNTGNNTYKAVQRETGALAIGPILQGLRKPVNDLSRGCSVDDIINTVLITAIQATGKADQGGGG